MNVSSLNSTSPGSRSIAAAVYKNVIIFYSNPRYILFIHLVMNDMLQLTLSTLLHIISYTLNTFSLLLPPPPHPRRHGHLQHASQSGRHGGGVLRRYLPPAAPL
ncbi:hypothetical protein JOQ06_022864 [Pogonophryne albipinna]|uniref:Uncharacterized protein n=1 Tax=Pogonophryne albipinna TaxID=1090488 RepID=A0AAD6ACJ3_9TELE|nr:hypothetical protein JOQ06_022864 [Pogonophryne albipinna]